MKIILIKIGKNWDVFKYLIHNHFLSLAAINLSTSPINFLKVFQLYRLRVIPFFVGNHLSSFSKYSRKLILILPLN